MRGDYAINKVSSTGGVCCMRFTRHTLDCRIATEIQGEIEREGQNSLSEPAHMGNDRETIDAWKVELTRILQVFNVRLAGPV